MYKGAVGEGLRSRRWRMHTKRWGQWYKGGLGKMKWLGKKIFRKIIENSGLQEMSEMFSYSRCKLRTEEMTRYHLKAQTDTMALIFLDV